MSVRRSAANTFFLSLHSVVAGVTGFLATGTGPNAARDEFAVIVLSVVGSALSLTWWGILRYYRRLSKAKWHVINELERGLSMTPFIDEWDQLQTNDGAKNWLKRHKHREATVVEQVVPLVFVAVYAALAVRTIWL